MKCPDRGELEKAKRIGREGENEPMRFDGLAGATLKSNE